jgi:hypothetical protein
MGKSKTIDAIFKKKDDSNSKMSSSASNFVSLKSRRMQF